MSLNPIVANTVKKIHEHASKCKKACGECHTCSLHKEALDALPPAVLADVLSNPMAPRAHFPLAYLAIENGCRRAVEGSKRANADTLAAVGWLKGYEERGGGI